MLFGTYRGSCSPLVRPHQRFDAILWLGFGIFLAWNGLSITAGYHRLWAHKSYEAHFVVRLVYALVVHCPSRTHQSLDLKPPHHHRYTDDVDQDPTLQSAGWYSHIGWMLRDYPASQTDFNNARDLERDPIVAWQHKYYWALVIS